MWGLSAIEDYKSIDYSMRQGNNFKADEVMSKKIGIEKGLSYCETHGCP
jgi:hypothetical protein